MKKYQKSIKKYHKASESTQTTNEVVRQAVLLHVVFVLSDTLWYFLILFWYVFILSGAFSYFLVLFVILFGTFFVLLFLRHTFFVLYKTAQLKLVLYKTAKLKLLADLNFLAEMSPVDAFARCGLRRKSTHIP